MRFSCCPCHRAEVMQKSKLSLRIVRFQINCIKRFSKNAELLFKVNPEISPQAIFKPLKVLREAHQPASRSNNDIQQLAGLEDRKQFNKQLDGILMPRVVGTENHEKVFNFIVGELKRLKWNVEIDEFEEKTPIFGVLKFKNIVAKLNPNAERFLALSCHYDSKYFKDQYFEAATDSAVPCAMMLNLAHTMSQTLDQARQSDVSLELIFFDGEEAFLEWGPGDSIYGAKHLAAQFENTQVLSKTAGQPVSHIQQLDMLVLLDLIGHSDVQFQNFFSRSTGRWYKRLVDIEHTLRAMNLLKRKNKQYFKKGVGYGAIEDDHLPFLHRNVPILHLISAPFPREWHTPDDSRKIIDMTTVSDLNLILRVFVSEYLDLLV